MYECTITVDAKDIIPPYNHVHHGDLLRFLEEARVQYLSSISLPLEHFFAQGQFLVIVGIEVSYRRELLLGSYTATVEEPRVEKRCLVVNQRIISPDGKDCVRATVRSMIMEAESRRSLHPSTEVRDVFVRGVSSP